MSDETEAHGSRRHVDLRITAGEIEIVALDGTALAAEDYECDLEIELSGVCGNHVIRINFADPHIEPES